jgi:hypothetical protein
MEGRYGGPLFERPRSGIKPRGSHEQSPIEQIHALNGARGCRERRRTKLAFPQIAGA